MIDKQTSETASTISDVVLSGETVSAYFLAGAAGAAAGAGAGAAPSST